MSKAVVCDRCGKQIRPFEAYTVSVMRFGIWHDLDVCPECSREYKQLYYDWLAEGRAKR